MTIRKAGRFTTTEARHYYGVGVPAYWRPIGGVFSAGAGRLERVGDVRLYESPLRPGASEHGVALDDRQAVFTLLGAGLLGLAHTFPAVNR